MISPSVKVPQIQQYKNESIFLLNDFDTDIAILICINLVPISKLATSRIIRKHFQKIYNKSIPVNYDAIFASCYIVRDRMLAQLKQMFTDKTPALCCDEWTSHSKKRFLNVQAYLKDQKISLGVVRIQERCTGTVLAKLIKQRLDEFGILS